MTKLMCLPVSHNIFDVSSSVFSVPRAKTKSPISLQFCGILVSLDFHSSLFNISKDCCILVCSYIGPISFCMDQKSQDVSLFNVQMQWALIVGYYPSLHRNLCTFSSAVHFDVSFEGWGTFSFSTYLIQPNRQLLRRSQAKTNTQAKMKVKNNPTGYSSFDSREEKNGGMESVG